MAHYSILGQLINASTRQPLANLRVEAWDRDLVINDPLGSARDGDDLPPSLPQSPRRGLSDPRTCSRDDRAFHDDNATRAVLRRVSRALSPPGIPP